MKEKLFTKNFTLLVIGQISSLFGNFILKFALSMHVLDITGSATVFAGILAVATIPTILLSPLGGILADRVNRRNIMVTLDVLSGVSVMGSLFIFPLHNSILIIGILLVVLSIMGAFETPTVQACIPQMQTDDNLIKGNAVINQVAAIAGLTAPILGSVLYVNFGLKPIMIASTVCFLLTAVVECFIKLDDIPLDGTEGIASVIKNDFSISMKFISRDQPSILKTLLLAALINFFIVGIALVGLPYIIRTILGLNAEYYGIAESALGVSAILGSIFAGLLSTKIKVHKLSMILMLFGFFLIPAGVVFLIPTTIFVKYSVTLVSFCGLQGVSCIFSVFALSYIQQQTPNSLTGKVMAYISTITMCAQPLGQTVYGLLFDRFVNSVHLVLIPTGIIVCIIGFCTKNFFENIVEVK